MTMTPTSTFSVTLEGPGNAVTTSKTTNEVAVAGRTVFKIFSIDEQTNQFVEKVNLRTGKNLNLNYSSNDVAWSPVDETILATGATNGAVVIWNVNRQMRRPEIVFPDHKRTVNTVCFHPTEVNLLVSCSQDGTMKLFDLRKREAAATFNSAAESVRDIQFSPHPDQFHQIASVQENGNVQLWDFRRMDRYDRQFTAHNGPVFSIDWHPTERRWLATAGRDKTIKVWDMMGTDFNSSLASVTSSSSVNNPCPQLEYCIQTIAPVARVRWRPGCKYQIASSSLVVDFSVSVWDIRRPFVPQATFIEHKDITRGFVWLSSSSLISAGKDNTLCHHSIETAVKPLESANPLTLSISIQGDITLSIRDDLISTSTASVSTSPSKGQVSQFSPSSSMPTMSSPSSPVVVGNPFVSPPPPTQQHHRPPLTSANPDDISGVTRRLSHQPSSTYKDNNSTASISSSSNSATIKRIMVGTGKDCLTPSVSSSLPTITNYFAAPIVTSTTTLPASESTTQTTNWNNYNTVSSTGSTATSTSTAATNQSSTTSSNSIINSLFSGSTSTLSNLAAGRLSSIFKPKSLHNSSTSQDHKNKKLASQADDIARQCSSTVLNLTDLSILSMDWFVDAAESYLLTGRSFEELCQLNAQVSQRQGRIEPWNAWRIIRFKYSNDNHPVNGDDNEERTIFDDEDDDDELGSFDRRRFSRGVSLIDEGNIVGKDRTLTSRLLSSAIGPSRHLNGNHLEESVHVVPSHSVIEQQEMISGSKRPDKMTRRRKSPLLALTSTSSSKRKGSAASVTGNTRVTARQRTSSNPVHSTMSEGNNEFTYQSDSDDSYVNIQPLRRGQFQRKSTAAIEVSRNRDPTSTNFFFGDGDWSAGQLLMSPPSTFDYMEGDGSLSNDDEDIIPAEAFLRRHEIPDFPSPPAPIMQELNKQPGIFGRRRHPSPPNDASNGPSSTSVSPGDIIDPLSPGVPSPVLALIAGRKEELKKVAELLNYRSFNRIKSVIQRDDHIVENMLKYLALEGDVQTVVSLLVVLGDRVSGDSMPTVDDVTQEKWFTAYIDLLARFQLWPVATLVTKLSRLPNIQQLNQHSTNVNLCCGSCGKVNHGMGPFTCKNCNTDTCICSVCNETVHGLYAWCEGCSHGGHLLHLQSWYEKNTSCPTGCGHECEYS